MALVSSGAETDELIRTSHLTRAQARTIISAVSPGRQTRPAPGWAAGPH